MTICRRIILFAFVMMSVIRLYSYEWSSFNISPFQKAIRDNDVKKAEKILASNVDDVQSIRFNREILINVKSAQMWELLEKYGAELDGSSAEYSPLGYAISQNNIDLVKYYIGKGAKLSYSDGDKPFVAIAAESGDTAIAELFLNRETINSMYYDSLYSDSRQWLPMTPLSAAISSGNINMVKLFIENGADPNSLDSPLIKSVELGNSEIFSYLLSHGAKTPARDESADTLLHYAAQNHKVQNKYSSDFVRKLITHGCAINAQNNYGETALHRAIEKGNYDLAQLLLNEGADHGIKDKRGDTPLHRVTVGDKHNADALVDLLIKYGADPEAINLDGLTALGLARNTISYDFPGIYPAEILYKYAKEKNEFIDTTLKMQRMLCERDYDSLLKAIDLGWKFDPDMNDESGESALISISKYSDEQLSRALICKLIEKGADTACIDIQGKDWLHCAFENGNFSALACAIEYEKGLALRKGFEVEDISAYLQTGKLNKSDFTDRPIDSITNTFLTDATPLMDFAAWSNDNMTRLYLSLGADPNFKNNDGISPLMYITYSSNWMYCGSDDASLRRNRKTASTAELLINNGARVNDSNKSGLTPMMYAVKAGNICLVELLLKAGAKINARDRDGWNALMYACENKNESIALLLLDAGADPTIKAKDGLNASIIAHALKLEKCVNEIGTNNVKTDDRLIKYYCLFDHIKNNITLSQFEKTYGKIDDINYTDRYGMTLLMWALQNRNHAAAVFCLQHNADVNIKCSAGSTALFFAIRRRNSEMTKELISRGADLNVINKFNRTPFCEAARNLWIPDHLIDLTVLSEKKQKNHIFPNGIPEIFTLVSSGIMPQTLYLMRSHGWNLDIRDKQGRSLLMIAAYAGDYDLVYMLLDNEASFLIRDKGGRTVLDYAVLSQQNDIIDLLHDRGVEPTLESCIAKADYYRNERLYDISLRWYERALSIDDNTDFYTGYGITLMRCGKTDEAEKAFHKSLQLHPENYRASYNLACLLAETNRKGEACHYLQKAVQISPFLRYTMKKDRDLDPLRKLPEFTDLLRQH